MYFGVSLDGFNWEQVNGRQPVLWSNQDDQGGRGHTIVRTKSGRIYTLAIGTYRGNNTTIFLDHAFNLFTEKLD
ncbi:hypothetical protein BBD42_12070 [Paenibacillus sp. BIHB 4019]|uniref:Uncharacterized protein n=1 Tax=Paenibacillus sp. BIHB 4019 TaxID=1870819 RepID=A0A1B2DHE3_9BACL|nr:hypothetical protein [Paenibacillus sp. BIHB 4019]ANY67116.1 hypothetical protein BBD42_12070 [Paenibacillus sp. BIHB 4019]